MTGFTVAGRRLLLLQVPGAAGQMRWAGREQQRKSLSGALDLVRSERFRPESDVVLPGREDRDGAASTAASVSVETVEADRAAARVDAAGAGHLVFSRTYFSAWKAKLDGRQVPVLVANARDLAVRVPPGTHRVEFDYDRAPFHRGVALQIAAFLAIAFVAARTRRPSKM